MASTHVRIDQELMTKLLRLAKAEIVQLLTR